MSKKRDSHGHGFAALRVVGALLPPEFLQSIASLDAKKQSSADYGISKSLILKDELARYWRIANDLYSAYVERSARSDADVARVGIQEWLVPLLRDILGYSDIADAPVTVVGERHFPITHRALGVTVPILLTMRSVELDRTDPRFGDDGKRRAAHGLMQDTLNADDRSLWGIVSNGTTLRVLRDNPSLTRPAYVEADLARIFEEQLYSDFAALWLTLHASRLQPVDGKPSGCVLETWRAQAHETGLRALEHLRDGVTRALRAIGNGFLRHPQNEPLRNALADGSLPTDAYFQELLRLVYRLLFLFAAEERNLLNDPVASEEQRALYRTGYGIGRLRERALRRRHYDRHADLWQGMCILFRALGAGALPLGIPALGGLFAADHCANLDRALIANDALLESIHALAFFRNGPSLARVNYRDMGTEELGSVYESLLELQPYLSIDTVPWAFGFVGEENGEKTKGSARKVTGSYYTPASLVDELITSTLEPVMMKAVTSRPEDPRAALLELKILDPACGSGHFLLAAARRIAAEIARIEAGSDTPDEAARQHALREVVQHCIYGVDRNPLAVELCRTALWIETVEPGRPLTFLDPHIQCGDSLTGIIDSMIMTNGIPDDAYKALVGDELVICNNLKRRNRQSGTGVQGDLFDQAGLKTVAEVTAALDAMPEETLAEVAAKKMAWEAARQTMGRRREQLRASLFVGAFFAPKNHETGDVTPISEDLVRLDQDLVMRPGVEKFVADLAERHRFFHWHVAFAEIVQRGGFDVVLGNPPWDVSQFSEEEYFAAKAPSIASLVGAARKQAILGLAESNPRLWQTYQGDSRTIQASNGFARGSGRFHLTARGKLNSYALFAETFLRLMSPRGRAGLIVPTGIATDNSTKAFFEEISTSGKLVSMLSFENEEFIFSAVHHSAKFCLLTLRGTPEIDTPAEFVFFARQPAALRDENRRLHLTAQDIELMNPNTKTAVLFRSRADAELTKKLYARAPVLIHEREAASTGNPWAIEFRQGLFNMTSDRAQFRTSVEFEQLGALRQGSDWVDGSDDRWVPLYEGKMIDLYDHRAASYEGRGDDRGFNVLPQTTEVQHLDSSFDPLPYYWVRLEDVHARTPADWKRSWLLGFRDVTNPLNERTFICGALPYVGAGHTLPLMFSKEDPRLVACLLSNCASIIVDYVAREKMGGFHVSFFYVTQFPVLRPDVYVPEDVEFIVPRVLELTYTSESMRQFASDLGFEGVPFKWNPERRAVLRAELDAYFARLYGLTRDELRYILDPADVYGAGYPSETFRVLKQREIKEFGEYRTARLVLGAWDALDVAWSQRSDDVVSVSA
jgi:hypothetical protein